MSSPYRHSVMWTGARKCKNDYSASPSNRPERCAKDLGWHRRPVMRAQKQTHYRARDLPNEAKKIMEMLGFRNRGGSISGLKWHKLQPVSSARLDCHQSRELPNEAKKISQILGFGNIDDTPAPVAQSDPTNSHPAGTLVAKTEERPALEEIHKRTHRVAACAPRK